MRASLVGRLQVETDLDMPDRGEFRNYYNDLPLDSGRIVGFEAC